MARTLPFIDFEVDLIILEGDAFRLEQLTLFFGRRVVD